MGCACKVSQQLSFLEKKYGKNIPKSKKTDISGRFKTGIKSVGIMILIIPITPVILIISLLKNLLTKKKTIDISKVFKISN